MKLKIKFKHLRRFLEFFIIGIVFGITEDMIAILVATDAKFSWDILWIVTLVAIPFAIFSELIVDKIKFDKVAKWWNKQVMGIEEEVRGDVEKVGKNFK